MTTKWTVVIIALISAVFLTLISLLVAAFAHDVKMYIIKLHGKISAYYHQLSRKYGSVISLFLHLKKNNLSYSVEIIFQLFCHFYTTHKYEMEQWGWDKTLFPSGRKDVSDMYKWITKTRPMNYQEAQNLVDRNGCIEYWGVLYNTFKSRINTKGELIITPHDDPQPFIFEKAMVRLYNSLYNLDTQKCFWIIERRKFFGF